MTLICARFYADLINISKVTSRKTKWPRFFGLPCSHVLAAELLSQNYADIKKNARSVCIVLHYFYNSEWIQSSSCMSSLFLHVK